MNVSARTPEGDPNRCPICGNALRIDPSRPPGDAPCPKCGILLWFPPAAVVSGGCSAREDASQRVIDVVCKCLGVNKDQVTRQTSFVEDVGADPLDVVEMVRELEKEFGITIPEGQAEQLETIGAAIDFVEREQARK